MQTGVQGMVHCLTRHPGCTHDTASIHANNDGLLSVSPRCRNDSESFWEDVPLVVFAFFGEFGVQV